ncbi:helix-turn-helix transcriptional regulator [Actinoplanes rectilineatus]|uniref:helix-turn-helix transcriptional regulator n=1 Tax=Actinoplanes rectilineatus TaxID=113571 RepID=UPI001FE0DD02|nr:helix-turn-helix transcriptional regulator [Actinoplanes rectilineatus]
MYGLQIGQITGLATGTIHPILDRLRQAGWLDSRWEDINPREQGRHQRRFHWFTADGVEKAKHALENARIPLSRLLPSPNEAPRSSGDQ